jgi:acyl-CoA synthetase (AMP-forming)/AMP-acid ligase II
MTIIHPSKLPAIDIPDTSITEFTMRQVDVVPDRPALIDGATGRVVTFRELKDSIHSLAGRLAAHGFEPGDTLGLVAPNGPEYAIIFHAVAVAGGTITTVNPAYGAEEIRFQLQDAGASLLITLGALMGIVEEAIEGTDVREIITIDGVEGSTPLDDLMGDAMEQVAIDPHEQVVVLPYSSGTTGLPKGVMLTHHNLVANLAQCDSMLQYEEGDSGLAVLPFFHIYGMQVLMNGMLSNGVTVVTLPRFDLLQALDLVQKHGITHFFAVPPMILALAKQPVIDNYDLSSLKFVLSGAAPLGAELAEAAASRIDCEVVQAYGMTELSPASHITPAGGYRAGSVGLTVPNVECRIIDPDTGEDQDVGGEGELWVRGPMVMKGYLNNPEATAETIDTDGWLHTGDVATTDAEGHFYIVDRVKELIKFKGFQVPPAELEAILINHPAVGDVAVIGVPDEEAGELPKAFVVLKPGTEANAEELMAHVAEHVAKYKQIRMVEFTDEIPKSPSGKILRRLLRDR